MSTPVRSALHPLEVLDEEARERLHRAGLEVLERVGVEVRDARACDLLAQGGARVEGSRARIPAGLVEQAVETAPARFDLRGRAADGSLDLDVRPGSALFGNGTDCLYTRDVHSGERRRAVLLDVSQLAAVCEILPNIDFVMSGVLPEDAPLDRIDLAQFAALLKTTRKPIVISPATAGETLPQMLEMAAIAGRRDSFAVLGMTNPPLVLDTSCVGKALACGAAGVPFICGPGNTMGTTAPASTAGAVAVGHAETLAALVVHQLNAPAAPFVYGTGAGSAFDMRTLVDVWVSPEGILAGAVAAQLAAALGLPSWDYAGSCDAKTVDGQLVAEMAVSTVIPALTRSSLYHDVGEYEAGVQNGVESLVLGDSLVGFARRLMGGVIVDDDALQLHDIKAVGPGGSYLGRPYTRRHYREAWSSPLFDTGTFERWTEAGGRTFEQRLRDAALDLVARTRPVVAPDIEQRLDEFWR